MSRIERGLRKAKATRTKGSRILNSPGTEGDLRIVNTVSGPELQAMSNGRWVGNILYGPNDKIKIKTGKSITLDGSDVNIECNADGLITLTGRTVVIDQADVKLKYDANNYATLTTASDGHLEIATTGTDGDLTLNSGDNIDLKVASNQRINFYEGGTERADLYLNSGLVRLAGTTTGVAIELETLGSKDIVLDAGGEVEFEACTAGFIAQTGTDAVSIDWGEGNKYHLLLDSSSTVTFATNPSNPCNLLLKIAQGAGGSNTITWAVTSGTIYWAGGGVLNTDEPTLTTTDDKTDILSFYFDGTNYFGVASLDFDTT